MSRKLDAQALSEARAAVREAVEVNGLQIGLPSRQRPGRLTIRCDDFTMTILKTKLADDVWPLGKDA